VERKAPKRPRTRRASTPYRGCSGAARQRLSAERPKNKAAPGRPGAAKTACRCSRSVDDADVVLGAVG
jgi:hypothetical protein